MQSFISQKELRQGTGVSHATGRVTGSGMPLAVLFCLRHRFAVRGQHLELLETRLHTRTLTAAHSRTKHRTRRVRACKSYFYQAEADVSDCVQSDHLSNII